MIKRFEQQYLHQDYQTQVYSDGSKYHGSLDANKVKREGIGAYYFTN